MKIADVNLPEYEIASVSAGTLVVTGLPSDGSVRLAVLREGGTITFQNSRDSILVFFSGAQGGNSIQMSEAGVGAVQPYPPAGWSFVS